MMFALASGRTLVLPPKLSFYLLDKVSTPPFTSPFLKLVTRMITGSIDIYLIASLILARFKSPPFPLTVADTLILDFRANWYYFHGRIFQSFGNSRSQFSEECRSPRDVSWGLQSHFSLSLRLSPKEFASEGGKSLWSFLEKNCFIRDYHPGRLVYPQNFL